MFFLFLMNISAGSDPECHFQNIVPQSSCKQARKHRRWLAGSGKERRVGMSLTTRTNTPPPTCLLPRPLHRSPQGPPPSPLLFLIFSVSSTLSILTSKREKLVLRTQVFELWRTARSKISKRKLHHCCSRITFREQLSVSSWLLNTFSQTSWWGNTIKTSQHK